MTLSITLPSNLIPTTTPPTDHLTYTVRKPCHHHQWSTTSTVPPNFLSQLTRNMCLHIHIVLTLLNEWGSLQHGIWQPHSSNWTKIWTRRKNNVLWGAFNKIYLASIQNDLIFITIISTIHLLENLQAKNVHINTVNIQEKQFAHGSAIQY